MDEGYKVIENGLIPVYDTGAGVTRVNARELHEFLESGRKFSDWIQDRLEIYGFQEGRDFFTQVGKSTGGRPPTEYWLTVGMAKELCMVENNAQGRRARLYFIEMEERAKQAAARPVNALDALRYTVEALTEQERRLAFLESNLQAAHTAQVQQAQQLTTLGHRVDSLDNVNIHGNLRQRLEAMITKYDRDRGLQFGHGWKIFDRAYNLAFKANLTALRKNYAHKHGLKQAPTRPAYFEAVGQLEDAIRIADKLLNTPADLNADSAVQSRLDVN